MYRPSAFREDRPKVLREAIRAHPLGTLVTAGRAGIVASLLPFVVRSRPEGDVLCAHLAKSNEQISELRQRPPTSVLFHGSQGYVSPSWYATKEEHGRVVPTWNYVVVQAWGEPTVRDDPQWIRAQIDELTDAAEAGRENPWETQDAPADFLSGQLKGIVGLEIHISRMEGKWKVSQNQPERNTLGVVRGLKADGLDQLAAVVAEKCPKAETR